MDYSLLLGLDPSKSELVGLVDAIGSFNLFKMIASRGKMALNRCADVTVVTRSLLRIEMRGRDRVLMLRVIQIPPDQYRERFENALRQDFVLGPWSSETCKALVLILSVRLVQTIGPSLHAEFFHPNSTQDCLPIL